MHYTVKDRLIPCKLRGNKGSACRWSKLCNVSCTYKVITVSNTPPRESTTISLGSSLPSGTHTGQHPSTSISCVSFLEEADNDKGG